MTTMEERALETADRLAERFWRIHPREIQDMRPEVTRQEFYANEIFAAMLTLAQQVREEDARAVESRIDQGFGDGLSSIRNTALKHAATAIRNLSKGQSNERDA